MPIIEQTSEFAKYAELALITVRIIIRLSNSRSITKSNATIDDSSMGECGVLICPTCPERTSKISPNRVIARYKEAYIPERRMFYRVDVTELADILGYRIVYAYLTTDGSILGQTSSGEIWTTIYDDGGPPAFPPGRQNHPGRETIAGRPQAHRSDEVHHRP